MQASNRWLKYSLAALFLLFIQTVVADDVSILPPPDQVLVPGCSNTGSSFEHQNLVLNQTDKYATQRLYLLKNKVNQTIWIDHARTKNPGAGAGWASQLDSLHWSALAIDKPGAFAFSCAVQTNNKLISVPCRDVLQTCQMATATFDNQNSGSYWVAENQYVVQLLALMVSKNIKW